MESEAASRMEMGIVSLAQSHLIRAQTGHGDIAGSRQEKEKQTNRLARIQCKSDYS